MEYTRENMMAAMEQWLKRPNMSVAELARISTVSYESIRSFRRGFTKIMRADDWQKIERAVGVSEDSVPVYGSVPAGSPLAVDASTVPDEYITYVGARPHYRATKVQGDSMNMAAREGSYVVFDPTVVDAANLDGKFVIVRINNETTFKRLRLNPLRLEPFSSNPVHQTIYPQDLEEFTIEGHVIGHVGDLSEG